MIEDDRTSDRLQPRARAVFSTEDFELLRAAVMSHMRRPEVQESPASIKYNNLFHRLGRL